MTQRVVMIGAGSVGFSLAIARELVDSELLSGSDFVLMDLDAERLANSERRIRHLIKETHSSITVTSCTDLRAALDGADFVITSYAPQRMDFWLKDIEIAQKHGVELLQGENGGPPGQIHALRNITIMMDIVKQMESLCPDAWIMNFTNPMSMLCTYLYKYTSIKSQGFCHQVHGTFGVIAEMLGMAPGDLRVFSGGINHMNFLLDIQQTGSGQSYMTEFIEAVQKSPYWRKNQENIPEQVFTLEFFNTFGVYPIGYDNHISEYMPFFYSRNEWEQRDYRPCTETLQKLRDIPTPESASGTIDDVEPERILGKGLFPFPKDPTVPHYREAPVKVIEAILTGEPTYSNAMILLNHGCISNLPYDAVVDIPGIVVGGKPRGIDVGELPAVAAELCRRQIVIHELVVKAAVAGDRQCFLEALCLDPFVRSLRVARRLMDDYIEQYKEYLPDLC